MAGSAPATAPPSPRSVVNRQRCHANAFTLAELLVSVGVFVLLVLLATQLLKSAANIATLGHKQMDADSQARELLDRIAIDVMQMVKGRTFTTTSKHLRVPLTVPPQSVCTQPGNDEMAFYSNVPGYYASDSTGCSRAPYQIVGYRINSSATTLGNRMERLGAGLVWNGASASSLPNNPVLFWTPLDPWSTTQVCNHQHTRHRGPQVLRFEYYYLLKNGNLSATPSYTASTVSGMQDVAAIVADIAVLDPKGQRTPRQLGTGSAAK